MKISAIALAGLAFLGLGALRANRMAIAHQAVNTPPAQTEELLPLSMGRGTAEEGVFRRLFGGYGSGQDLRQLSLIGDVSVSQADEPPLPLFSQTPESGYPNPELADLACRSDFVVVGTLHDGSAHLTERDDFLFSVYSLAITHVVKQGSLPGVRAGGDITVVRPGGSARINGHVVRAVDPFFPSFATGQTYILFLKTVPGSSAGQASDEGSFLIRDGKAARVTTNSLYGGIGSRPVNADGFLAELKDAVIEGCPTSIKGGAGR